MPGTITIEARNDVRVLVPSVERFKSLTGEQHLEVLPEKSIRASNRPYVDPHSGMLHCMCGHEMGQLQWPLAAGIHHLNGRCRWSCCNASWEEKSCSHDLGNVVNERSKYKPWEKTRTYDSALESDQFGIRHSESELVGTLRKSKASDKANELLSSRGNLEELKEKEVGEPCAEAEEFNVALYVDPTPSMENLGEVIVEGAAAAGDGALYGAGVVASLFHSNLIKPFLSDPVMIPAELEEILQAIIECDNSLSENHENCLELLAAATKMYLAILELSDAQFLTIESWIEASSAAWKSYHKAASAPLVMIKADEVSLKQLLEVANVLADEQLLAELQKCCFEDSRSSKPALKATRFLDWYVMNHFRQIKFTIPEVTGFPLLLEINLSAAASALKKKPSLYSQHKDLITQSNFTFDRAIQCGLDFPSLSVGCVAGDEESYTMFRDFYIAAIVESGVIAPRGDRADVVWDRGHRGCKDWSFDDVTNLNRIDTSYVRHCAVKARRNLSGISFPTHCSRAGRRKVERIVHAALTEIEGEFAGSYQPLFKDTIPGADTPSDFCRQIGAGRDWPWGRGVYKSDDQSLCVFVNGEDHLNLEVVGRSLLGRTENCDIVYMFQKLSRSVATIEHCLFQDPETSFATSPEFGFLTSDPAKCGTALDVEYGIKLDNLTSPVYGLHAICARLGLSCSPVQDGLSSTVWSISVVHRIGCSEVEMMQTLVDGVVAIITIEKTLERKDAEGFAHLIDMLPRRFSLGTIVRGKASDDDDDHEHDEDESATTFPRIAVNPEDDYPLFNPEVHNSLMSKHLTRELYTTLRSPDATKSACGWSISQLIRVGVEVPSHPTGILMGGVESYETYKHLLAPILIEYHGFNPTGYDRSAHITDLDLVQALNDIEAIASVYLRKMSISTSRNLSAFPFPPSMSRKQRRMVEFLLFNAFKSLDGELVGNYVPLRSMNKAQHKIVAKRGAVFVLPSYGGPLVEGGCARDMPDARGVFMSKNGRVMGLINGENHVNVIVEGGSRDVADTVKLFAKTMDRIEAAIQPNGFCFAHSDRLGYLTTRVEEVGTALRMRFSVVLPALSKDPDQLMSLAAREDLTVTQDEDNNESWTFTNIKTLCISETETLKKMLASLLYISRLESSFRKQAFTPALDLSLSNMRRKSLTSQALVEAVKQRSDQVTTQKAKAAEDMSRFITSHKGRSASRSSFFSVLGSLLSRAEEEERQRREARYKIASVLGSQRKEARVRMSFHSLMDDLKASVPMTPSEKFFLETSESPNKRDSLVGGDMFISLAPDTPLVSRNSPSPERELSERMTPPLSPPKPPRAMTPTITTAEQETNNLVEDYKKAIGLADKGRSGVFTTIRTVALPPHMESSITKGVVAMVGAAANTAKDKPNTTKFEVFIDPISFTLHWGRDRGSQHKCLTLADCSEVAVHNKTSMFISRSEVYVSFKTESETVKIQLPVDSIMNKQKKINWATDLKNLFAMRSKTITFTPAALKFLGL